MTYINCVAIEDEPHALQLLKHYADQVPYLRWLGGFQQPLQALPLLNEGNTHLLLLDINLPGLDGISFYKSLAKKPQVIFTTAYAEHAAEGFSVEATDYLLKPIQFDRFIQACNKVLKSSTNAQPQNQNTTSETLFIKSGSKWHQINWDEVTYLEKDENYVIFHTADGRKILTRQNLGDVELTMPSGFCRVHKSFIVNVGKIKIIERDQISIGNKTIPLADTYRNTFMNKTGIK